MRPTDGGGWGGRAAPPLGLKLVFGLFLAAVAYLVAASLARREQPTYPPSAVQPRPWPPNAAIVDTLTVDARDASRWRFVDLERRSVVLPPDTQGWDLAFRRFHVMAAAGVADLGGTPLDSVRGPPRGGYLPNDTVGDTVNLALRRWYRYGFTSHLLEPKRRTYAVRTSDSATAVLEILSYYCPGLTAGCPTIRYRVPVEGR